MRRLRQDAWGHRATLDVRPTDTHEYCDQEFGESDPKPNIYYIPKLTNEEALNSFIWYSDHLFVFQFTLSKEHSIDPGIVSWFTACTSPHNPTTGALFSSLPMTMIRSSNADICQVPNYKTSTHSQCKYQWTNKQTTESKSQRSIEEREECVCACVTR